MHQWAIDVIVIDPAFVAGVIGRIDVDALDFAGISREECLECVQVIAMDDKVIL